MGLLTEVVPAGEHLARALEMAEGLAGFPQETMLADRRAALEGLGLPLADGLALEAQAGPMVFADAVAGAARFAGGEGRGGAGPAYRLPLPREETRFDLLRHRGHRLHRPPPRRRSCSNREGEIYVLVREGSQERLEELIEGWERRRARRRPSSATSSQRASRRRRGLDRRAPRQRRPLLPPRGGLRHDRRRRGQRARSTSTARATPSSWPTRSRPASCTTPPRSPSPAPTRACSARTCSTRARSCRRPTTARSSSPSRSPARSRAVPWRVYRPAIVVGHSKTGEMDKIDGPYYFFKAIQKAAPLRCRSGSRSSARSWATRTSSRSTTWPPRWTTSPTSPASTARPSISRPPSRSARARSSTRSPGPRTRRSMAMRIDKRLTEALPKGVVSMLMKLPALKDVRRPILADFGIPEEVLEPRRLHRPVRHARHRARARRHGHRGPAARQLRRAALGLLGAQPRPGPVQGPLVRARRQRRARSSSPAPRAASAAPRR